MLQSAAKITELQSLNFGRFLIVHCSLIYAKSSKSGKGGKWLSFGDKDQLFEVGEYMQ